MNKFLPLFIFSFFLSFYAIAQNFKGQWKGEFIDKSSVYSNSGSNKFEYTLELDLNGNRIMGSSYTYFNEGSKRYYTICKVEGFVDPQKKYIEVKETSRTKTNIPNSINNCLQIHKLSYSKEGSVETIMGNWVPAPNQSGDCGYGFTYLKRLETENALPDMSKRSSGRNGSDSRNNNRAVASNTNASKNTPKIKSTAQKTNENKYVRTDVNAPIKVTSNKNNEISGAKDAYVSVPDKLVKRKSLLIQTFEISNSKIEIELLDNGEIDGDIISLFFNKKTLLSNKRLTEKPIKIELDLTNDGSPNELIMFAENLGSIPPNTALIRVYDGSKKFETRITSDLENNGLIKFIRKKTPAS